MTDQKLSAATLAAIPDGVEHTPAGGLTEAQVHEIRAAGKGNDHQVRAGRSVGEIIRANVFTRINAMLGVLFVIVLCTGSIINAAFGLLIIANSAIGIIQEIRAKRMLDKLSIVGQTKPTVQRRSTESSTQSAADSPAESSTDDTLQQENSTAVEIPATDLVEGDLIVLSPGEQIVVDGEILSAQALDVDESLLTGENDPVHKDSGDVVLSGSFVVSGSGVYQATRVGTDAYAAKLAAEASQFSLTNSQLMSGINKILKVITWLLIPTGLATIYTQLCQTGKPWKESVLSMTAALVPMVPEGLVLMTSIAFFVGVIRLGEKQCLVQELPAIEGLARVDVVCTDKTGTLTNNTMTFKEIIPVDTVADDKKLADMAQQALIAMAVGDEHPNDSMRAIADWAKSRDNNAAMISEEWVRTSCVPFSSDKKWSAMGFGKQGEWMLGAPDVLAQPGSQAASTADEVGSTGMRVLLLARSSKPVEDLAHTPADDFVSAGIVTPAALVVLQQSVRSDAADTLDYFQHEGVDAKVVSGDNANSVGAVARELNMVAADAPLDARSLPKIPDNSYSDSRDKERGKERRNEYSQETVKFAKDVESHTVFGRVTPEQKRLMVQALQHNGHTVAMTGDGVNDVLALKHADIGVAMGSGASAARSVAQIVLLDNRFATLPSVVGEGRRVIGNIERVANLFLTKTIYSVLLALFVVFASVPFPFQPIHVTITGWFTIGIPAFLLSLAPNNARAKSHFVQRVLWLAVPSGVIISAVSFTTYMVLRSVYKDANGVISDTLQTQISTATLSALIVTATWVLCVVARPLQWWKILLVVLSAAMYPLIFLWPFTAHLFFLDATNGELMKWGLLAGVCGAILVEIFWWIAGVLKGERQFVWERTHTRFEEEQHALDVKKAAQERSGH